MQQFLHLQQIFCVKAPLAACEIISVDTVQQHSLKSVLSFRMLSEHIFAGTLCHKSEGFFRHSPDSQLSEEEGLLQ